MSKRSIGYIKKVKDGKYFLRLSCGYDDFGRRIQPSRTVYCSSDREAEKLLMDFYLERERMAVQRKAKAPATLEELYQEWTDNHVNINLTPKTAEFYAYLWERYLKPSGKLKLKTANAKNIHRILCGIEGERTRNAAYKMLKAMFNKAIKWGYMQYNPCDQIDTPKYKPKEKKTLSEDDIHTVMAAIQQEELKFQAIFYFAAMCGMRKQEVIGLKWSDIDFKEKSFTIRRAATTLHNIGTVSKETKTEKSNRTLYLPDGLDIILLKHMNQQNEQKHKCGDKWIDEDWIFTQWNGALMDLNTPSHWWHDFALRNGIEGVTFHGLRHTAATFMIKNNVPISTVSGVLGHAQISTTLNTYTHVIEDTKRTAIAVMSDVYHQTTKDGKKQAAI